MISVIYLKSASSGEDFYEKKKTEPEPIKIEKNNDFDVFEVEKIVAKRLIYIERGRFRRAHFEFRVK